MRPWSLFSNIKTIIIWIYSFFINRKWICNFFHFHWTLIWLLQNNFNNFKILLRKHWYDFNYFSSSKEYSWRYIQIFYHFSMNLGICAIFRSRTYVTIAVYWFSPKYTNRVIMTPCLLFMPMKMATINQEEENAFYEKLNLYKSASY